MTRTRDDALERLITRYLDGEATADERRALDADTRADPAARALLDSYRELDARVGEALRSDFRRASRRAAEPRWYRIGRVVALAAAACIAAMICLTPATKSGSGGRASTARGAALFRSDRGADVYEAPRPVMERPHVRFDDLKREWIMIPTDSGIMVVEIDRVRSRLRAIHEDY